MPDLKEKLVELLKTLPQVNHAEAYVYGMDYVFGCAADHLIAHGVTVQEWISVNDRLPEDASTVLAIDSDGTISSAYYVGRWHSGGDLDEDAVTYWMPLPTAPNEDEQ